ncbi:MAG: hypothetical protein AB7O65_03590 [Candidatus Korobacteraceae bacterium]
MRKLYLLIYLTGILVTIVTAWILSIRMRRRMQRALGKEPRTEMELTSLTTWMEVHEVEDKLPK